jgi:hypothetical protein
MIMSILQTTLLKLGIIGGAPINGSCYKARKLLINNLNRTQKDELARLKYFHVTSSKGRQFKIDCTRFSTNIFSGAYLYCLLIKDPSIPYADTILAQKLLIESDEDYFLHLATRYKVIAGIWLCEYRGTPMFRTPMFRNIL